MEINPESGSGAAAAVYEDALHGLRISGRLQRGSLEHACRAVVESCVQTLAARAARIRAYSRDRLRLEVTARFPFETGAAEPRPDTTEECPELFADFTATAVFATHGKRQVPTGATIQARPLRLVEPGAAMPLEWHAPIWVGGRMHGVLSVEPGIGPIGGEAPRRFLTRLADLAANAIEYWQRRDVQQALSESEDRFQVVAETSGAAIFSFDDRIRFCNEALTKMLGWRRDELIDRPLRELLPESTEATLAAFRAAREAGATRPVTQELAVATKEGGRCWLLVSAGATLQMGEPISLATAFDITERKRQEAELEDRAYRDALTKLPNRNLFRDRLAKLLASGTDGAVLLFDIDRFRDVNNALGRDYGDQLLIAIAQRVAQQVRDEDTVARLGGDQFGVLLPGITGSQSLDRIARRLARGCGKTIQIDEHSLHAAITIGIRPNLSDAHSADVVLAEAEVALQHARASGHGGYSLFAPTMLAGVKRTLALSTELRQALDRAEFRIVLQPIVELSTGRLGGFEALLRWVRSTGSPVPPLEFIPYAEESGLIVPIGNWVFGEACKLLARWSREFPERSLFLSVNVSGRQLQDAGFITAIRGHLRQHHVDPMRIKLEVTESTLLEHSEDPLDTLQRIKRLGMGLSLDDFGTGYSSLSHLHRFPFDVLKIDRSFVEPLRDPAPSAGIVDTILALGRTLEMEVVAEGIETPAQLERLRAMGCAFGQGYLLARPLDLAAAEQLLRRETTLPEST